MELFKWQKKCLDAWFNNKCHGIVNVATGAGKTVLALAAISQLFNEILEPNNLKIKIVVPKTFLVTQWTNDLIEILKIPREEIGCHYGGYKSKTDKRIMIYVINSARYTLSRHILNDIKNNNTVFLICDECHHYSSNENIKIFDFVPVISKYKEKYLSMGLSATPHSQNGTLTHVLGKEIYKYDFKKAKADRIVSDFSIFNIGIDFTPYELEEYEDISDNLTVNMLKLKKLCPEINTADNDTFFTKLKTICHEDDELSELAEVIITLIYKRREIIHCANSRVMCVYELIKKLKNTSKIIIFGERIKTAEMLYKKLRQKFPGQVGIYHSEIDDKLRRMTLYKYKNSEIRILISCRALDEGLNIPETDVGIIMSSTSTIRQRIQRLGRVIRRKASNEPVDIYYLHIQQSNELEEMLPKDGINTYDIYFNYRNKAFYRHEYDVLCEKALSYLEDIDEELLMELKTNFERGILQNDWLISQENCKEKIRLARKRSERNYRIAMLQLIKAQNVSSNNSSSGGGSSL